MNTDIMRAALRLCSVVLVNTRQVIEFLVIDLIKPNLNGFNLAEQVSVGYAGAGQAES